MDKFVLIDSLVAEVNEHAGTVKNRYQSFDDGVLLRPAPDGGWSIAQCLDHLNGYGQYYLPLLANAIDRALPSDDKEFKSGWLGDYFTKMMAPETGTRKYKAFKGHIPPANLNPTMVLQLFVDQQAELQRLLQDARAIDLCSVKIPISISRFIKLSIGDTLRFIIAHNRRHLLQAERNLQYQLEHAA